MKQRLFICLIALVASVCNWQVKAQDTGIQFEKEGTLFKEAVEKAKQTGKKIFLDCYTSWCGPCKMMMNTVFPQKKVGDYMNSRFVNIKINMEQGEGPALGKKLQVNAYPTFVVFNSNGDEIGRFLGGCQADEFLVKVAKAATDNTSAEMDQRFMNGERDPEFLKQYLQTLSSTYKREQCNDVAEILLEGKAETFAKDKQLADIFMRHIINPFCPAFIYTVKQPEELTAQLGESAVQNKLFSVWNAYPRQLLKTDENGNVTLEQEKMDKWIALMDECNVSQREELKLNLLLDYTEKKTDWTEYVRYLKDFVEKVDPTDLILCKRCTPVVQECKDLALRKETSLLLEQRLSDLRSGKRSPQTRQGNMMLSGDLSKVMEMLIQRLKN